jgi:hypothetical protein
MIKLIGIMHDRCLDTERGMTTGLRRHRVNSTYLDGTNLHANAGTAWEVIPKKGHLHDQPRGKSAYRGG